MAELASRLVGATPLNDAGKSNLLAGIVILAGGASKRMGTPKAELILPSGERLLDYHVRQALELSAAANNVPVMIADNGRGFTIRPDVAEPYRQSPLFHIADYLSTNEFVNKTSMSKKDHQEHKQIKTGGALVAIEAALQYLTQTPALAKKVESSAAWLLVISCDSLIPVIDLWQTLQLYIAKTIDKTVVCLTDDRHLYPLLGLYQLSIEPDLKAYIDEGQRQVMRFIEPIVHPVTFTKQWQPLTNFNTPSDFKRACLALSNL